MLAIDLLKHADSIVNELGENAQVAVFIMTKTDVENEIASEGLEYELTDDKLQYILEQVQEMAQFEADQCIYTILHDLDNGMEESAD